MPDTQLKNDTLQAHRANNERLKSAQDEDAQDEDAQEMLVAAQKQLAAEQATVAHLRGQLEAIRHIVSLQL